MVGVDGSSPSEGLSGTNEVAAKGGFFVAVAGTVGHLLRKEGGEDGDGLEAAAKLA
jgi:hypothetical protein